jgi:hypothetical protein
MWKNFSSAHNTSVTHGCGLPLYLEATDPEPGEEVVTVGPVSGLLDDHNIELIV